MVAMSILLIVSHAHRRSARVYEEFTASSLRVQAVSAGQAYLDSVRQYVKSSGVITGLRRRRSLHRSGHGFVESNVVGRGLLHDDAHMCGDRCSATTVRSRSVGADIRKASKWRPALRACRILGGAASRCPSSGQLLSRASSAPRWSHCVTRCCRRAAERASLQRSNNGFDALSGAATRKTRTCPVCTDRAARCARKRRASRHRRTSIVSRC